MAEISFNSIFDGVSLAIHRAFPPPVQVHGGQVEQGLRPGDFNVVMPGAGHSPQVGSRYRRTPTLDVLYYPRRQGAECYEAAHRLTQALAQITTPEGDLLHCTACQWTVTDGVLHLLVGYDHFVLSPQEGEAMEALTIEQEG